MIGTTAFSHQPRSDDLPFNPMRDFLEQVGGIGLWCGGVVLAAGGSAELEESILGCLKM